jgi:opacity protein-like surface antigen
MTHRLLLPLIIVLLLGGNLYAQTPVSISPPLNIDLGFGGGVSLPLGKLSDADNTGFHGLVKARLHGFMPLNVVASGAYNRLANKTGSESDTYWMIGAGLEYPLPTPIVKPYFGIDALYNVISNTGAGSSSSNRGGLGVGAGVEFALPGVGSFDTSVKYQVINITGKETNEETYSQVAVSVALMFGVL